VRIADTFVSIKVTDPAKLTASLLLCYIIICYSLSIITLHYDTALYMLHEQESLDSLSSCRMNTNRLWIISKYCTYCKQIFMPGV
jgi:hypothetical protein